MVKKETDWLLNIKPTFEAIWLIIFNPVEQQLTEDDSHAHFHLKQSNGKLSSLAKQRQ